jgi:hypothetical protein
MLKALPLIAEFPIKMFSIDSQNPIKLVVSRFIVPYRFLYPENVLEVSSIKPLKSKSLMIPIEEDC